MASTLEVDNITAKTANTDVDIAGKGTGEVTVDGKVAFLGGSLIRANPQTINEDIVFAGTENGMSTGPITIASGKTVTVTSGSTWRIV